MASQYTTSLKIQEIGNGEQSGVWGTTTNTNWMLIEQAVAGVQTITMTNANYTLSNLNGVSDEARNMVLVVQGTNSGIYQVVAPLNQPKMYVIYNNTTGGYAITIGAVTGSVITVPNGVTAQVYTDGTNFYSAQTGSAGNFVVNGTLTASGLTDAGNMSVGGTLGVTGVSTFTGAVALNGGGTSVTPNVGDSSTKIATTAFVTQNSIITGAIQMWPTASAPSGYLNCDGSAVSRTTYSALYAVVGTTFGTGDGSTTFNLPNYTNRMPYGTTIGATGGSADAVVVSHTHTATSVVNDPGHSHTQKDTAGGPGVGNISTNGGTYITSGQSGYVATAAATTGISVSTTNTSTGVSGTNANLPPYLGINFIIKT
jgi:microcystin-dependent protein